MRRWIVVPMTLALAGPALLASFEPAEAQWSPDSSLLVHADSLGRGQDCIRVIPDGEGGAFIASHGTTAYQYSDDDGIMVQRVDATGHRCWQNGVALTPLLDYAYGIRQPDLVPDGHGGVIVAWKDRSLGDPTWQTWGYLVGQRFDSKGRALWGTRGVILAEAWGSSSGEWMPIEDFGADFPVLPRLVADGNGGAFVVCSAMSRQLIAQHVTSGGELLWHADPYWSVPLIVMRTKWGVQWPDASEDGSGGIIIAVQNDGGTMGVRRITGDGRFAWGSPDSGIAISAPVNQWMLPPAIAPDGFGGATVVWSGSRDQTYDSLRVQRVSTDGIPLWRTGGVPVDANPLVRFPKAVGDGQGGVWAAFQLGATLGIRVVRLSAQGEQLPLPNDGVLASQSEGFHYGYPSATPDGSGGVIVTWVVGSNDAPEAWVRTQRIDASGALRWGNGGIVVAHKTGGGLIANLASDGQHGTVVAWPDGNKVRAQHVDMIGTVGLQVPPHASTAAAMWLAPPAPNPAGVSGAWIRLTLLTPNAATLSVHDLTGRRVRTLLARETFAGERAVWWDGRDDQGHTLPAGVFFLRADAGAEHVTQRLVLVR